MLSESSYQYKFGSHRYAAESTPTLVRPEADVWAAGLVLYEMLTCVAAYHTNPADRQPVQNWYELIAGGLTPESVCKIPDDAHPVITEVARACMVPDPSRRISAADSSRRLASTLLLEVASQGPSSHGAAASSGPSPDDGNVISIGSVPSVCAAASSGTRDALFLTHAAAQRSR